MSLPSSEASIIEVTPRPRDGVTSLSFTSDAKNLLLSSWSGHLSYHSSTTGILSTSIDLGSPILRSCLIENGDKGGGSFVGIGGCLDGCVREWEVESGNVVRILGRHEDKGIAGVGDVGDGRVASVGWDGYLRLWDRRADGVGKGLENGGGVEKVKLGGKGFALAVDLGAAAPIILVGNEERAVAVFDIRKMESLSKKVVAAPGQIRTICSLGGEGGKYVVGTSYGRISVESFGELSDTRVEYFFKCHRDGFRAFPVNGVISVEEGMLSCGGDGRVCRWNVEKRKRVRTWGKYETGISAIACKKGKLAIAVSYAFEEGERDWPQDRVEISNL